MIYTLINSQKTSILLQHKMGAYKKVQITKSLKI